MKFRKALFFILLFTALVFSISCHGKGNKYDEFDDWDSNALDDSDQLPGDSEPSQDTDTNENEPDGDTDSQDDSDADTNPDETPDVTDEDTAVDDTDTQNDNDADTNPDEPDETGDEDSIPEKEDPAVICTGQNKCFGNTAEKTCPSSPDANFFGQDAQYAKKGYCLLKSYTTTSDLVTDNITGLIWQRKLPTEGCANSSEEGLTICTKQEAIDYCKNLNYAGFSDWRLPTPEEFATIKSFGSVPAVDTEKFPLPTNSNEKFFWTAYSVIAESGKSWAVDFHKGETIELSEQTGLNRFSYVRCVRGDELTKPDFKTFTENEEDIVYDYTNNLKWTKIIVNDKEEAKELSWQEALKECEDLEYAGETEWRLPNINELASIIDYSRYLPASEFPSLSPVIFWSSTSYVNGPTQAWVTDISSGAARIYSDKIFPAKVLCVK